MDSGVRVRVIGVDGYSRRQIAEGMTDSLLYLHGMLRQHTIAA
jgi:hypothetical protein